MSPDDKPAAEEYRVATAEKIDRLVREVNKLIDAGWKPLGGVSVSHAYDVAEEKITVLYAQALRRR